MAINQNLLLIGKNDRNRAQKAELHVTRNHPKNELMEKSKRIHEFFFANFLLFQTISDNSTLKLFRFLKIFYQTCIQ